MPFQLESSFNLAATREAIAKLLKSIEAVAPLDRQRAQASPSNSEKLSAARSPEPLLVSFPANQIVYQFCVARAT
jgi:hypothetical protein